MNRIATLCCLLLSIHASAQQVPDSTEIDSPLVPTAIFTSNSPQCYGSPVCFTDQSFSSPPFGWITTWVWDFGDGTVQTILFPNNPNVCHIYPFVGLYAVTLTVTDNFLNTDDYSSNVIINPNPIANFMFMPACDGQPVQFTDLSQNNGLGFIVSWEWDFGDPVSGSGNTSNLQNPVHLFTGPGTYQVTLNITNNNGCENESVHQVTVSPQSSGGSVTGSTTIIFGQNTGPLDLAGQTGTVVKWQKQHNAGGFTDIASTSGLTTYSEVPIYPGTWEFRAVVQSGTCAVQNSLPATVVVNDPPGGASKTWNGLISDSWGNPDNWSPSGVPQAQDNIVVPSSAINMPKVLTNGFGCSNVTVTRGATLTIVPTVTLTVSGHLLLD